MFALKILENIKEVRLKCSQVSAMTLQKRMSFEEARIKLTNTQLNKLKFVTKNSTGATLRISKKNFQDEELQHELFVTTRQKTKTRTICQ